MLKPCQKVNNLGLEIVNFLMWFQHSKDHL